MIHDPPTNHHYRRQQHNKKFDSIWLIHPQNKFNYTNDEVKTIWGFIDKKTNAIHSPINSKKPGPIIDPLLTTPWTAMPPPKVNPLQQLFSM
tara:strand:- start:783 stop:1058 length:276 start_codon:yes stop_codon:yes gene_type:complete